MVVWGLRVQWCKDTCFSMKRRYEDTCFSIEEVLAAMKHLSCRHARNAARFRGGAV